MFIFISIIFMIITYGCLIALNKQKIDVDTAYNILGITMYIFTGVILS